MTIRPLPTYPGYDVLDKRDTPSWDDATRAVIAERLATPDEPTWCDGRQWHTLRALCATVIPQPAGRAPVPLAALVDRKIARGGSDGYRNAKLPPVQDAWSIALAALDDECRSRYGVAFGEAGDTARIAMLQAMQHGTLSADAWEGMPPALFFTQHVLHDVCTTYYAHPTAWSEIGFGGPANPRGYVRMNFNRRDPWKPPKRRPVMKRAQRGTIAMPDEALHQPRGKNGRAPDVFTRGGWIPMCEYPQDDEVDFAIVGTGAGGATLACRLAEKGFRVVAFDAGAWWRPLEEFASDEQHQSKLYWTDERIVDGSDPLKLGSNNSGKAVGGSTVHFAMVSLRFRPEWFKSRTLLGYGADWPVDWREMWRYYGYVEDALKISGPVRYPWGPQRPRYPYRPHELNAAALVLARGAEALGIDWAATPLATLSAPRGAAHPCVYRGFCVTGCATNAKQSALVTWIPRAVEAGAEIRDLAMVGRIATNDAGRATGVEYLREGRWQFQRAKHVVVAGYAIETPRLLLMSANSRFPDGLANRSGLVGKNLMVQLNQAVWGELDEEIRWYKGPPSLSITEHWNYEDKGKDFFGGYSYMSQGPLPNVWAETLNSRGLWGQPLLDEMQRYNHQAGLKMVGETLPQEHNRVTLADQKDQYGLPVARVTWSYGENDRRMIDHALKFMGSALEAAGGRQVWAQTDDTCHLNGTARMGDDPATSVVDADCRSWDIPNLWICDGSVFPTVGGVNPSLTIQAIACRTADRIEQLARRGEL